MAKDNEGIWIECTSIYQSLGLATPHLRSKEGERGERRKREREKERKGKKRKGEKIERWIEERKRKTEKLKAKKGV